VDRARLLVVDDEPTSARQVTRLLDDSRFDVTSVTTGREAVTAAVGAGQEDRGFDVVLLDYYMPGMGGVDVLRALREQGIESRIIIMSGREPGEVAVEAMRLGAFDFISKPLNRAELKLRLERALRDHRAAVESSRPDGAKRRPRKSDVIIGGGTWIKELYERISMVAPTDVTVAVTGESGTGKELVARTIHALSQRYESPFVVVNCAAIPETLLEDELFGHVKGSFTDATKDREGLFAAAHTGTLFLDEIGEMPLALQVKLLRVLQSQEFRRIGDDKDTRVDVRLITATNRDLEQAVAAGVFRQDLFYRINVFPLALPPLRERREDIPLLAHHFLLKHRAKVGKHVEGFTPEAMTKLCSYDFPGNVRELENTVHHALVMVQRDQIYPEEVRVRGNPGAASTRLDLSKRFRELKRAVVESFEREYAEEILRLHGGNIAAAARQAGIDRKNLWSLVKKYGIDVDSFRRR